MVFISEEMLQNLTYVKAASVLPFAGKKMTGPKGLPKSLAKQMCLPLNFVKHCSEITSKYEECNECLSSLNQEYPKCMNFPEIHNHCSILLKLCIFHINFKHILANHYI